MCAFSINYRQTFMWGGISILMALVCIPTSPLHVLFAQVVSATDTTPEVSMPLDVAVGQIIIVGVPDPVLSEETKELLRQIQPGGVVLYARNIESLEQLATLVASIHVLADGVGAPRPFIMVDEEPNGITRLDLLTHVPRDRGSGRDTVAFAAQTLAQVGVTVDLAPVADFPYVEDTFIAERMPLVNEDALVSFNAMFIQTMAQYGVATTLKHFPGAGMFVDDPHSSKLVLASDLGTLDRSLHIFAQGVAAGAQFVMTNHALYKDLDPDRPATISPRIVSDLLRDRLGFRGIIITDDIEGMFAPTWEMDPTTVGVEALKAGHTMVMYAHDLDAARNTYIGILETAQYDPELARLVKENGRHIQQVKES